MFLRVRNPSIRMANSHKSFDSYGYQSETIRFVCGYHVHLFIRMATSHKPFHSYGYQSENRMEANMYRYTVMDQLDRIGATRTPNSRSNYHPSYGCIPAPGSRFDCSPSTPRECWGSRKVLEECWGYVYGYRLCNPSTPWPWIDRRE